jgi:hypothetical protein
MKTGRLLFSILLADFRDRTRRTSFLVTLCLVIYLGYAVNTGQVLIKLDDYRGIYNSAWVGGLMTLVITFFLGLAGFYLVKNTIDRDERTGVGQIIASTPITRPQYLLGKWCSNFTVLAFLVIILALAAILMQAIQQEAARIEIWTLIAPLLLVALPMMALVAAFAVFFESIPWLKGGFGNLVYFFVFTGLFTAGIFLGDSPWLDVTGVSLISTNMKAAVRAISPEYTGEFVLSMASDQPLQTFVWSGLTWSAGLILQRLSWFPVSAALVLFGSIFFNRFNPRQPLRIGSRKNQKPGADLAVVTTTPVAEPKSIHLTSLKNTNRFRTNFFRLVWLEILLLVKGLKWYWLAGMAILWIGCLVTPTEDVRKFWYIATAIWPILVWSKMGERETHYQAEQIVFQGSFPVERLLLSGWVAGVILTGAATLGVLAGRLLAGDSLQLQAWLYAVVFIPSMALVLGVWSRTSKLFEVIYSILWYLGPMNKENGLAMIDYLGIHTGSPVYSQPLLFASFILGMLVLAYVGRRTQLQSA